QDIKDLADDNILTALEKKAVALEIETIKVKYAELVEFATNNQIDCTDYIQAYNSLIGYITPILSRMDANSVIVRETYRQKFTDYYKAETNFWNSLSQEIRDLIDS